MEDDTPLAVDTLASMFGFAPDALALNRCDKVTPAQRQDSIYRAAGMLVRGLGVLVLDGILIAALVPRLESTLPRAAGLVVILAAGITALLWFVTALRVARPIVRQHEGIVHRAGDDRHPAIRVDGIVLRISHRRWKRLPPVLPGRYRVYTTHGPRLLSLEPLRPPRVEP